MPTNNFLSLARSEVHKQRRLLSKGIQYQPNLLILVGGFFGAGQKAAIGRIYNKEYSTWTHIKQRCYDKNSKAYRWYGARGIRMSKQWKNSFTEFFADMGPRPEGLEIDRIDNDGNYSAKNCRWTTQAINLKNRRKRIRTSTDLRK